MPDITQLPAIPLPMQPGDLLPVDRAGTTYNAPVSAVGGGSSVIDVVSYGADPTGVNDSYAAIQTAINTSIALGLGVDGPSGIYKLSQGLVIGAAYNPANIFSGWQFFGSGMGGNGKGGTVFRYTGTGSTAILQINGGTAWRNLDLHDFTLLFASGASASYGIFCNSTEFSQLKLRRIKIDCETTVHARAVAILTGTGANGEFTTLEEVQAFNVDGFYYTNAGQAFTPDFRNCYGFLNAGGIHFDLDIGLSVPGGGLTSVNYNGGSAQSSGISNSIFLRNNGNTSSVSFTGGRVEHVTAPYLNVEYSTGGYAGRTPNTSFNDLELTCDFDATNGALTLPAAVTVAGGETLLFKHVQFERDLGSGSANITFPVNAVGNNTGFWGDLEFDPTSTFSGFLRGPDVTTYGAGIANSIRLLHRVGLLTSTLGDRQITQRQGKLIESREMHARSVLNDNLLAQIGQPENRISNPQIADTNGATVAPLSPWVLTGAATIGIQDWNGTPHPRDPSQYSRLITLAAGAVLYQDIAGMDLSAATDSINGRACTFVSYTLAVNELGGTTTAVFSLENSVTGQVYDIESYPTSGNAVFVRSIELKGSIAQTGSTSHPRIKIANTGAGPLTIDLSFQSVGSTWNQSFGPVSNSVINQDFLSLGQLLIWGGLNIPVLLDKYGGFGASNVIPWPPGRLYIATDDDKLTYNDGTNYHKVGFSPRFAFAGAAYGPTITVDASQQETTYIGVTDNVNFTISNPINPLEQGQTIEIMIANTTGGAIGTATFDTNYRLGASWTQPGAGKNRTIEFKYINPHWIETYRSAVDVSS